MCVFHVPFFECFHRLTLEQPPPPFLQMNAYYQHLEHLVQQMYEIDESYALNILAPFTRYPHVPPSALIEPSPENRRGAPRRSAAVYQNTQNVNPVINAGAVLATTVNGGTPQKRKRFQHNR